MMVYIVTAGMYEDYHIDNVFDNMASAQARADELNRLGAGEYGGQGVQAYVGVWEVKS